MIGDGACCLNCLAAWILLDPKQGPILGRDMNTHIAEYRRYYKEKISFPLTVTLAGGEIKVFQEGDEDGLKGWRMRRECVCLIAIRFEDCRKRLR